MRYLVGFVLILAAVGVVRLVGCGETSHCVGDWDCDDDNPCTYGVCVGGHGSGYPYDPDASWLDCSSPTSPFYCDHREVDDGTSCEIDGQYGVCESGDCQLDGVGGSGGSGGNGGTGNVGGVEPM
jgi:hypothetical protein